MSSSVTQKLHLKRFFDQLMTETKKQRMKTQVFSKIVKSSISKVERERKREKRERRKGSNSSLFDPRQVYYLLLSRKR